MMFLSRLLPTVTRAPLWTHLWDQSASEVWLESADLSSGSGSSLELSSCSSSEVSSTASVVDSANAFTSNIHSTKCSLPCFDVELLNILWYNWYLITQSYNLTLTHWQLFQLLVLLLQRQGLHSRQHSWLISWLLLNTNNSHKDLSF